MCYEGSKGRHVKSQWVGDNWSMSRSLSTWAVLVLGVIAGNLIAGAIRSPANTRNLELKYGGYCMNTFLVRVLMYRGETMAIMKRKNLGLGLYTWTN